MNADRVETRPQVDREFIDSLKEICRKDYGAANRNYKFELNEGCESYRKELLEFRQELDFEFVTKELHDFRLLNLHETMSLGHKPHEIIVTRVMGGWIYNAHGNSVFVPEQAKSTTIAEIQEAKTKIAADAWEQVK